MHLPQVLATRAGLLLVRRSMKGRLVLAAMYLKLSVLCGVRVRAMS